MHEHILHYKKYKNVHLSAYISQLTSHNNPMAIPALLKVVQQHSYLKIEVYGCGFA